MSHAFTANDTLGNDFAIFIDSSFAGANTLKLGVMRADVFDGSKDPFAEQTIALWLLGSVVNCFGLGNFAMRPFEDVSGASYG